MHRLHTKILYAFAIILCYYTKLNAAQERCETDDLFFMNEPGNCTKYILCKDGIKHQLDCGDLKFNPKTGKCANITDGECEKEKVKQFHLQEKQSSNEVQNGACYIPDQTKCKNTMDEMICDASCDLKNNKKQVKGSCTLAQSNYKVVCYYTNFSFSNKGKAKFFPSDLDPTLCSHILYYRASIDNVTLTVSAWDPWVDFDNGGYQTILNMKAKGPKVMLVIGGWSESNNDKFSKIVGSAMNRKKVIDNILAYLEKWGFDGVEIDWQFPKCWQKACSKGFATDSSNFLTFMKELNKVLKRKNLLLSTIASRSTYVQDESYDIAAVSEHVDWITLQTLNYHKAEQGRTGHVAPLYDDTGDSLNVNYTIHYVLAKGVKPRKIVMALPTLANNLKLSEAKDTGYNSIIDGMGPRGDFLNYTAFLGFSEVCYYIKIDKGWTVVRDPKGKSGPYAYKEKQWVSYDDIADVKRKCDYIREMNLGGAFIWSLAYDDIRNRCGCGKFPIGTAVAHELLDRPNTNNLENCT